jgi:hypothetical protein
MGALVDGARRNCILSPDVASSMRLEYLVVGLYEAKDLPTMDMEVRARGRDFT